MEIGGKDMKAFVTAIVKEIREVSRKGDYFNNLRERLPAEEPRGEMSRFQKAALTLYKRDILKFRELNARLVSGGEIIPEEEEKLILEKNVLESKIKITHRLFARSVRRKFTLWWESFAPRRGFIIVLLPEKYTIIMDKKNVQAFIEKEMGVNTGAIANA